MAPKTRKPASACWSSLAPNRDQVALFAQTDAALKQLGFRKDIGFDTRGFPPSGTVPFATLPTLLKDLRFQPSGWVLPRSPTSCT